MIIECPSCRARYRLKPDRIRGKGARVRCRHCGGTITVLLEARPEESPTSGGSGGFLDLGSAVRESLGGSPAATAAGVTAALPDHRIPFPGPGEGSGQAAVERASAPGGEIPTSHEEVPASHEEVPASHEEAPVPRGESPVPGDTSSIPPTDGTMDEVELAFERLLTRGAADAAETSPAAEGEFPPGPGPGGGDIGSAAAGAGPGSELPGEPEFFFLVSHRSTAEEGVPPSPGAGGFLLGDSDTLDFLKEVARQEGPPPAAEKPAADISLILSDTPVDDSATTLRAPSPPGSAGPVPAGPVFDISSRLESAPSGASESGMALEGSETPPSHPPEVAVPPFREETPPAPRADVRAPSREKPAPSRQGASAWRVAAAGVALLALAGNGYYFGFTPAGRKTLESVAPGVSARLLGRPAAEGRPGYDVRNVIGYYENSAGPRKILVIKGQVTNLSAEEKSGIRVFTTILDPSGKVLAERAVYAGNVLPSDVLRKIDPDRAAKFFDNRFGEGLANMHVGPGKSVPFMVVFFDAPESIDSYRLEARDGD